ncbi:MAG: right-handed parallel beta-helix repeat-containing protein [Kiritimatiellae bacterium]|nr:right-handed parallel beta-helix repeat-containing protein [Kiritimatiellia bacterium]
MDIRFICLICALSVAAHVRAGELVVEAGGLSPREALEAIRAAKAAGDVSAWTVVVRKGRYVLDGTLVFTPADSGSPDAPVVWRGEDGVVISGGSPIDGWEDTGEGWWQAPAPVSGDGAPVWFESLYVDGRRETRARIPDEGFLTTSNGVNSCVAETGADGGRRYVESLLIADDGAAELVASVPDDDLSSAQLLIRNKWAFARRNIRSYDRANKTVVTYGTAPWREWMQWDGDSLFCIENIRSGFDREGEWLYDAAAGKILYRPRKGQDIRNTEIVAPLSGLSALCAIRGDCRKGEFVSDLRFENLVFEYSTATGGGRAPTESDMYQAAVFCDGAWTVEGATRCVWDRCTIRHTDNYAMKFGDGVTRCEITGTLMEDLGAGGIWMGAGRGCVAEGETLSRRIITTPAKEWTAFNTISNCVIRHGGLFNPEGTGIALSHCADTTVTKCDIYDFFYSGVSVGWPWGYRGSVAQRNTVSFNRIHDLGKRTMSDMGGVYTLGTSFGTCVSNNAIWNVKAHRYGGLGLYNDEGSEGVVMENNLCWDTHDGGYHQHYGVGNTIRNNIFALNGNGCAIETSVHQRDDIPSSAHFVNNIVYIEHGSLVHEAVRWTGGVWAHNLWYNPGGGAQFMRWNDGRLADYAFFEACGREIGGMFADPLFVDVAARDFRLKPESPAFALGFKPFDPSLAGSDLLAECGE